LLLLIAATSISSLPREQHYDYRRPENRNKQPHGKWFQRIVVVNLENTDYSDAMDVHYLQKLASEGVLLTRYSAITHPSEPNYVTQVYGSDYGIQDDDVYDIEGKSLVDLLEKGGVSWKTYQEKYPGNCFLGASTPDHLYVRKHNPFLSMNTVHQNPKLCAKVVDEKQLDNDIKNNAVPQLVYYTPDMNDDGHDTDVKYASNWLRAFFKDRLTKPNFTKDTLFFVTFDEQEDYSGNNRVYAVMFGEPVKHLKGKKDSEPYSHYSLLRTIEDNWNLGNLGRNDTKAKLIKFTK
jgi:phospholipase C